MFDAPFFLRHSVDTSTASVPGKHRLFVISHIGQIHEVFIHKIKNFIYERIRALQILVFAVRQIPGLTTVDTMNYKLC